MIDFVAGVIIGVLCAWGYSLYKQGPKPTGTTLGGGGSSQQKS